MQHSVRVEGFGFRLRPVRIEDAAFIVELRSDKERSHLLHPISPWVEDQEAWIRAYLSRGGDYYFIVEDAHTGRAEGTIALYDVSAERKCGEVGRWIIRRDSAASYASLILAWQTAFEVFGLDMFYTRAIVDNVKVKRFLTYFGLENRGVIPEKEDLGGVLYDMVEYCMTRTRWFERRERLQAKAAALTRLLREA